MIHISCFIYVSLIREHTAGCRAASPGKPHPPCSNIGRKACIPRIIGSLLKIAQGYTSGNCENQNLNPESSLYRIPQLHIGGHSVQSPTHKPAGFHLFTRTRAPSLQRTLEPGSFLPREGHVINSDCLAAGTDLRGQKVSSKILWD